jgi:PKD repeat protein
MVVAPAERATVLSRDRPRGRSLGSRPQAPRRRWLLRCLPAIALAAAALGVGAPAASAVIVQLANGKTLSYQPVRGAAVAAPVRPFDSLFKNLDYNGGPVMPSNTNYTIYWDPPGTPEGYPAGYQAGVNRYLEDLAHDSGGIQNADSVSAQYNDAAGQFASYQSHFGGTFVDKQPYPTSGNCNVAAICLTDAQIQAELTRFVKAEGLPMDLEHEYFLLTPPKVESCFEEESESECSVGTPRGEFCAYHGNAALPEGHELIYSNDPYVTGNPGCDDGKHPNGPSDGALQGGLSHEHNESITDPEPNNAWTDIGGETGEVGDKCDGLMGGALGTAPDGSLYNQVINGHLYWYQEEWSNQGSTCLQRLSFKGTEPEATFTATAGAGREVKLDASASTATGGVYRYNWQFNDGPGLSTPVETSSPTVARVFPCPSTYTVALTVFAANGTSNGTAQSVVVGSESKPAAVFSVSGGPAIPGAQLSFDGSGSTGCPAIASYSWNFGDGSPLAGGAKPKHAYAAAGSYEVTLTVTDSSSRTGSITHTLVIGPAASGGAGGGGGGGGGGGETAPIPVPLATLPAPSAAPGTMQPLAGAAAPTATVALATATAQVQRNGWSTIRLTCAGSAPACIGRVTFTVKVAAKGHRARTVAIATAGFTIAAGRTSVLRLRLRALGRSLLRNAHGHLPAQLALSKSSPAPSQEQSRAIRLALLPALKHSAPAPGVSG